MPANLIGALVSVLPVLILVGLGIVLRMTRVLDDSLVAGLKKLTISVVLPAVLFTSFLTSYIDPQQLWAAFVVFVVCAAMLGLGLLYGRRDAVSPYTPFMFTGFELGILGFTLFAATYGAVGMSALSVLALGHEVFVWLVFVTVLRAVGSERRTAIQTMRSMATSPVIIAIVLGLGLNLAGVGSLLGEVPVGETLMTTLNYLAAVVVPLVLIVVGYGTKLSWAGVRSALPLVAVRLLVMMVLALAIGWLVFTNLLGLPPIYRHALFTLMVLPPPFILPFFIPRERSKDTTFTSNVLSLHTLASLAAFAAYVLLTGV